MGPRRHRAPLALLLLLPLASACELTEVTVAPGQRVVVVQSVISRNDPSQFVVVEYSEAGDVVTDTGPSGIPPGIPRIPIGGARVTIEHQGGGGCAGRVDTLPEAALQPISTGIYSGPVCLPEPGDRMLLRVETPAGEVVTGSTTVPGASTREVAWTARSPGPGYPFAFDRERDTIHIGVTPVSGRALQIEARNNANFHDLAFFAFTDTMGMNMPGNLVNPFEGDSGETLFRAGRDYTLAVALTDTNYYDFLRSRSDPFTGRGFINHLTGGIGVFGSVETERYLLHVVAPVDDPREGMYRLTGTIDTLKVDATLELYLDEVQRDQFSAFVRSWPVGGGYYTNLSSDGAFPLNPAGEMEFHFAILRGDSVPEVTYQFAGVRQPAGTPFPVIVHTYYPNQRAAVVDTLSALQISGPSPSARR